MILHPHMYACALKLAALAIVPVACASDVVPSAGWRLEPSPKPWSTQGFVESLDLSGIASINGRHCLVASDELTAVQSGHIDGKARRITAGALVPLMEGLTGAKLEIDIEGVAAATDGSRYYITGSHGVGKKKGDVQPGRYAVYEVPVDPATGAVLTAAIRKATLRPWLEQSPVFAPYLGQPLQMNGLNIEGLASAGGRLYFGLRGPNLDGSGFVLETDAETLFRGDPIQCVVHTLRLGQGRGVRDLVACRDGFLVVAGNASAEPVKKFPLSEAREPDARFQLGWWRPGVAHPLIWIGEVSSVGGKAEGLLVLEETSAHIDVLCLFDGAPEGGPTAYRLYRPALAGPRSVVR